MADHNTSNFQSCLPQILRGPFVNTLSHFLYQILGWFRTALISDGRNITKRLFAFTEMQGHYHDCDQYWKLFWRSCTIFHSFWNSLQTAFLLSGLEFLILYGYFSYWLYKLNTYAAVITYSWLTYYIERYIFDITGISNLRYWCTRYIDS